MSEPIQLCRFRCPTCGDFAVGNTSMEGKAICLGRKLKDGLHAKQYMEIEEILTPVQAKEIIDNDEPT